MFQPRFDQKCAGCNQPIVGAYVASQALGTYHPNCLKCSNCDGAISDDKFITRNGKALHSACAKATSPLCSSCNKPITGSITRADGNQYHAFCFVCAGCGDPLTDLYTTKAGKNYCIEKGCGGATDSIFQKQAGRPTTNADAGVKSWTKGATAGLGGGWNAIKAEREAAQNSTAPPPALSSTPPSAPAAPSSPSAPSAPSLSVSYAPPPSSSPSPSYPSTEGKKAKFCPGCGKPAGPGNFCAECGTSLWIK